MAWTVRIGQADDVAGIRTQVRVTDIRVTEEFAHKDFTVTVRSPTDAERTQNKGRIDSALIEIKRNTEDILVGYIESTENGTNYVTYSGRTFLVLMGYSTSGETDSGTGVTKAEYDGDTGAFIIDDLMDEFCFPKDGELVYSDLTFTEVFGGEIKLHGKKVYQIVQEMCNMHGKDLWSTATWTGNNVTSKNIHVGTKSRGNAGAPHKTLRGGVEIAEIPMIKYRTDADMVNAIRIMGKGSGKERITAYYKDDASIALYGTIEVEPLYNNMIADVDTALLVGQAIVDAKKEPIAQLYVDPAFYINDLQYGDWVRTIDSYSGIDVTKRIKKITYIYNSQNGESMEIELGEQFNNYENIVRDLTKGDVDPEPEMTLGGGSLRITANDPPNDWVRVEKGSWYGTDGVFYEWETDTSRVFWAGDPPYHATTVDNYFKALIQIKDAAASATDIEYKTSMTAGSHTGSDKATAKADAISPDDGYTPIGEIILKCEIVDGTVYAVTATDEGESYIYRDVRPIIGSSATGLGGSSPWEVSGSYSQLITARPIDMQGYEITKIADLKGSLNADLSLYGSNSADSALVEFLQWDHSTEQILINRNTDLYDATVISPELKFRVPLDEGYSGFYVDYHSTDGLLRFRDINADSSVMTLSDTGILTLIDDLWMTKGKEINFGTPNTAYIYQDAATEDLKFYDTVLGATKTLSELAAGGVPSGGVQGDIIYHDAADWVRLAAGTSGYVLQSQGAAANPVWAKGLPTSPAQGDVVYYNGSNWVSLAAGSSGNYLKTLGAGNNPVWFNVAAGFVTDPLTSNLDANGYDINDLGDLDFRTSLTYAYINFDSNDDFLRYDCTSDIFEFKIGNNIRFSVETEEINAYYNLDMNNKDVINVNTLKAYSTNNLSFWDNTNGTKTLSDLVGGGLWEVDGTETQLITADDIDMQDFNIIGIGDLKPHNVTGIDVDNSAGTTRIFLGLTSYAFKAQAAGDMSGNTLEMGSGDITQAKNIKGLTTGTDGADRLNLDFRGDASHRIYYTGISDNRLKYETASGHLFSINTADICQVSSTGLHMASGKYIKSDSGDLELRAPSGSKIKFVIG